MGVVIAALAVVAQQPPPPTVAEFAPQAQEMIEEAPDEQAGDIGRGGVPDGDGGETDEGSEAATSAEEERDVVDVSRVRQCVGDPPRQIEDPQSPPCVPYWSGDNGGATSRGVTGDQITIISPWPSAMGTVVSFFNHRFEFYGRKLVVREPQYTLGCDPASQRADATAADSYEPFAAGIYHNCLGAVSYNRELARRKIITVAEPMFTSVELKKLRPYVWQYAMENDLMLKNLGSWGCNRLEGQKASHAGLRGHVNMSTEVRKFAVVEGDGEYEDVQPDTKSLVQELEACGANFAGVFAADDNEVNLANLVIQLKEAEVTSVFCLCAYWRSGSIAVHASNQQYFPEWLLSSYGFNDYKSGITTYGGWPPEQREQILGLTFLPRLQPHDKRAAYWAYSEAQGEGSSGYNGDSEHRAHDDLAYRSLLLIASGIQMAGPNLTPETFEAGLQRTKFPNPDHPIMAGKVGFNGGSYAMTIDGAEFYWRNDAASPYTSDATPGSYCYVSGGERHSAPDWPKGGDPFVDPCDSGA